MKNIFVKGDIKIYEKIIMQSDVASFESGIVHEVYSTFSVARDAEWCGRLFVLDMKEYNEEGIGTQITVQHIAPAFVGEKIRITTAFDSITAKGEILTSYNATVGERLIAKGIQGQRILLQEKIKSIFDTIQGNRH
jgi:fluoroacetyl-CoA thioesterase